MKTKRKLLIALLSATCLTAGAFGLAACTDETSNRDPKINEIYAQYVAVAGDNALSYDEWLNSIKGAPGTNGTNGEDGKDGKDGKDGTTWLTGETAPAASEGKVGDLFLDTKTFDIYLKGTDGWTKTGNIKGTPGASADKGEDGKDGKDGATWLSGAEDPDEETEAKKGDFYLNTTTCDLFVLGEEGWEATTNLKGVGIDSIELDTKNSKLIIYTTDEDADPIEIPLAPEVLHSHKYSTYKEYDELLIRPTFEANGLAYKKCTDSSCDHIELVAIPKRTGSGKTKLDPVVVNDKMDKDGNVYVFDNGYDDVYYEYTLPEDGYVVVTTPVKGWETSCMFEVFDSNEYSGWGLYSQTNIGDELSESEVHFKAGTTIYVSAEQDDFDVDGKYPLNFKFYKEDAKVDYTLTLAEDVKTTDADGNEKTETKPISNVSVQAYKYVRDAKKYEAIEGAVTTTDKDGKAIFNLPIGSYYFGTAFADGAGFADVVVSETKIGLDFTFEKTVKPLKYEERTITVALGDKVFANAEVKVTTSRVPGEGTVISSGTTDTNGIVKLKAVKGQYIHATGLSENYKANVASISTSNKISLDVYWEVSFTEGKSSFTAQANTMYYIPVTAAAVYSIKTDGNAYLINVSSGYSTYVYSNGGIYEYYAKNGYFTYKSKDNTTKNIIELNDISKASDDIYFYVSAGTTVTVTENAPEKVNATAATTEVDAKAGKTYLLNVSEKAGYTLKVTGTQGEFLKSVNVDGKDFVNDGTINISSYYAEYVSAKANEAGKAIEFKTVIGAAEKYIIFTVNADVKVTIVKEEIAATPVTLADYSANLGAKVGTAYIIDASDLLYEEELGTCTLKFADSNSAYFAEVKLGDTVLVSGGKYVAEGDIAEYCTVEKDSNNNVTVISVVGFGEDDLIFEASANSDIVISVVAYDM